jgi:hypothetical protein
MAQRKTAAERLPFCLIRKADRFECEREDLNLHGIAPASPSSWCVCQFRHAREYRVRSRAPSPVPVAVTPTVAQL